MVVFRLSPDQDVSSAPSSDQMESKSGQGREDGSIIPENVLLKRVIEEGMDFDRYLRSLESRLTHVPSSVEEKNLQNYARLNLQRMQRIWRTYRPVPLLARKVQDISEPQIWMVLTEDWCGDSAHVLPYLARLAEMNPQIQLKILRRDEHPDIMDRYLTDGKRSIPKWVVFDQQGREQFIWGPRPKAAGELFARLQRQGVDKKQISEQLQRWYNRDRGKSLEAEILAWLESRRREEP